jgi:hypothetical protein
MQSGTLALASLILQFGLFGVLLFASYQARVKRALIRHCFVMRIAGGLLILSVIAVMAPSFFSYATSRAPFSWFTVEVMVHTAMGLSVTGLWVYVNLAMMKIIRRKGRLLKHMRWATGLWIAIFAIGLHMYAAIWLGLP